MDSIGSIGAAINRRERAARKAQGMTREQFKALPKGARVVVISSGKVYEVLTAAHEMDARAREWTAESYPGGAADSAMILEPGWWSPRFRQWRTGEAKHPAGRLYGPAFVSLRPANVRLQEVQ